MLEDSRFRTVVEDQTEVIVRFLPDGTFTFVNEVYCRLFGKSPQQLIGRRWQPGAHPDDIPMIEAKLRAMSQDNPVVTIENRVYIAGDELRWMQFVNRGFYDADGHLKEIQSVGRDITALKQTEIALRESEERLEMALAGSGLALWDWDITNHEVITGNNWFSILGYALDEVSNKEDDWFGLVHPSDLEKAKRAIASHLAGDSPNYSVSIRMRHKDGHWVDVESIGKVTKRKPDGTPLRMVGTVLDITQRKRLNDEGIALLKQIETLIRHASNNTPADTVNSEALESLTKRERQILTMIADGMTSAQIGKQLKLATNTIISHRQNLMTKLDLHSTAEVTRFAMENGLMNKS